jgi:ribA/ribD-fused uncharacterized protein
VYQYLIEKFRGQYSFLSNMHPVRIPYQGLYYPSVEHAYQASKTLKQWDREPIRTNPDPVSAKKMGRQLQIRPDWEEVKLDIMRELLSLKFNYPHLSQRLLQTNPKYLKEGNTWHDNFWGSCTCLKCNDVGENHLGKLLMDIRNSLCQVQLWTARYNYSGPDRYDVTVKSGDKVFAPTWKLVRRYKDSCITWPEYVRQYTDLMRGSYRNNKPHWINLLQKPSITLVCFCTDPTHCHRTLLAEMLARAGNANNISVAYHGERT